MDILGRDILIWLSSLKIGNSNINKIICKFPDLINLWYCKKEKIESISTINNSIKTKIISNRNEKYLKGLMDTIKSQNIKLITILDENYPSRLNYIDDKPNVIYVKGNIIEEDNLAIGIVGSRKCTSYGKWATEKFTKELVDMDITIISGLASGIDAVAHDTALKNCGRTIAVLGNGIDKIYPNKNKELYKEIEKSGAVITEFPLGTQPLAYNFPQRNRIISGMSLGVIVIEAQEKSGSLITATHALNQGKDVFALPGNINSLFSKGTNKLIRDGARPLLEIDDIIEEIYELRELKNKKRQRNVINFSDYSEIEIKIIKCIEEQPAHCDEIAYKTGLDISSVASILTILELKGIVKEIGGRVFTIH